MAFIARQKTSRPIMPWIMAVTLFTIALSLSMFTMPVRALILSDVTIDDTLDNGAVHESITMTIVDNTLPAIEFSLPAKASNVLVNNHRIDPVNGTIIIPLACKNCTIDLRYALHDVVVNRAVDEFTFSRTLNLPRSPGSLVYILRLPPGAVINTNAVEPAVVPASTELSTDGSRIIIRWAEESPKLPQQYLVRFSDHEIRGSEDTFITELGERPVWFLLGIVLLLGIAIGFMLRAHLRERFSESESLPFVPANLLSSDERIIINLLTKRGTLGQKELGKELVWSKSKVSAIMTGLERKEIVSREKVGRNYKITLEKAVKE